MTSLSPDIAPDAARSYIKDVNVQNFMLEVIQASLQTPVLVYFTAPWCGPCKQYGPLLEKVVNAAKGKVKLARVDIDKNPQLAQQFRIQSVPMVYIFVQGQPLDGFAGALPESQLKQLINQVAGAGPGPENEMVQATLETAAALLAEGKPQDAEQAYASILAADEDNTQALAGLARSLLDQGHIDKAEHLLGEVPPEKQSAEAVVAVKAAVALAKSAPKAADLATLQKAAIADPQDMQARLDFGVALFAAGKQQEAVDEMLAIIARDKQWNDGAARAQCLAFFEALALQAPLPRKGGAGFPPFYSRDVMTAIDPKLLEILVCPLTKGALRYDAGAGELISDKAKLAYPIRDGIPIMLVEEARKLE